MFGLCDCNNFFVSCERVFNPSLESRPVIVLSNNDGCVVSRSNEAKSIGIKMGQPLYQIHDIIKRENVAVYSANYHLYGDMSQRVMTILKNHLEYTEVYSIDEAFMQIGDIPIERLKKFGEELARTIHKGTGIPVSIGISHTKTLAKIASRLCKRYPRLNSACLMYRPEDIEKVLSNYPVKDVWGIGRRHGKMLADCNIKSAWQFRMLSEEWVHNRMSITGVRTWRELQGVPSIEFSHQIADKQTITVSRSFAKELYDIEELRDTVSTFAAAAAEKLRQQRSVARQLQLFIFTTRHREELPQHNECATVHFVTPTDSSLEIVKNAVELLKKVYRKGFGYKKSGITLGEISPSNIYQSELFDTIDRPKHKSLMKVIDKINAAQGPQAIKIASQGSIGEYTNRQYLSPQYTTKWEEIPIIKV